MTRRVDVAVVGAGPAGATVATLIARAGIEVVLLERAPTWRWRACGVFASPATMARLHRLELDSPAVRASARPIPAMRVEPPNGPAFRLTYGADRPGAATAIGFDRSALDPALVDAARAAGAEIHDGVTVTGVERAAGGLRVRLRDETIETRVVVGADGIRSTVASSLGVARSARFPRRIGLSYHLPDPRPGEPRDARMRLIRDGYVGFAPVRDRVNVGIVLGDSWRAELRRDGAADVAARIVASTTAIPDDPADWRDGEPCDRVAGAATIAHRVAGRAGDGWILVGDAAGFLDPFTGEGLHRAFVTADLGARAVIACLGGRDGALVGRDPVGRRDALQGYGREVDRRFAGKDLVTMLVQAFLARPTLFGYAARRLAARGDVRETMGLVIGDLVPASRAIDPRFLAALLAP